MTLETLNSLFPIYRRLPKLNVAGSRVPNLLEPRTPPVYYRRGGVKVILTQTMSLRLGFPQVSADALARLSPDK
jgi:hypothetical protein